MRYRYLVMIFLLSLSVFSSQAYAANVTDTWTTRPVTGSWPTRSVHDFDCSNCHNPSSDLSSLTTNLCLNCHASGSVLGRDLPLRDAGPGDHNDATAGFAAGDSSDAMGSVTAINPALVGDQTSHNWAASEVNTAAGAKRPTNKLFSGAQAQRNYSGPVVSCARCHNPHGWMRDYMSYYTGNPKLLKLGPDTENAMCIDCHSDWANDTAPSEGGSAPTNVHPMVTNYAAVAAAPANSGKYNADVTIAPGEVALNATGGIDCMTCHGVHWTDSDASTTDGFGQAINPGDGKVLKANGPSFDAAVTAKTNTSICQTCHTYADHGAGRPNTIGCLVCHGAHLEADGSMNNYMLRKEINTFSPNGRAMPITGLTIDLGSGQTQSQRLWNYCFACHDDASAAIPHNSSWTCSDCHSHSDTDGSWTANGACNTCHGFPPVQDIASDRNAGNAGYAVQSNLTDSYANSGHFKAEDATLHSVHANGAPYSFSCNDCHAGNGHIDGSYDDVFISTANTLYNGDNQLTGGSKPTYVTGADITGPGTCSSVYCHSNGGPRSRGTMTVTDPAGWLGGAAINDCFSCHGNSKATMATLNNSDTHEAHLDKGYSCQVCHSDTADSASALAAGAIGGTHVDGTADVAFNDASVPVTFGTTSYGETDGTCGIYCHSNGSDLNQVAPDWDDANSGACGSCHQYDNAGTATGSGAALGGAHTAHVFDTNGPQLACTVCHTHDGSTGAANTTHVNGAKDLVTNYMDNVCNPCHGSTDGGTGDDAEPVWATPSSVTCQTCHAGTVIATIGGNGGAGSYVDKRAYPGYGHGDSGLSFEGTYGGAQSSCEGCHDASAAGHLNGNNNPRLKDQNAQSYAGDNNAWCQECHTGVTPHFNTGGASTAATQCATCHDPHGQSGNTQDAMIVNSIGGKPVSGFTNKDVAGSYFSNVANGSSEYEGICQVCHIGPDVAHYTRTAAPDGHNAGNKCISCHTHTTTPEAFKASCNGCHGDANGQYWPDNDGDTQIPTANQAGRHLTHVTALAQKLYSENIATLLTDNVNGTSDTKQKAICEYCHAASSNDGDHGLVGSLPADVFEDFDSVRHAKAYWGANDANATYNAGNDTCSTTACHNNKTTTDGTYGWYDAGTSGCIMCHDNVTTSGTHLAHINANGTYGLTIACTDCHTASTAWGTAPDTGHWDGSWTISGSGISSYTGTWSATPTPGSCGTNDCHNNGLGGQPADNGYTWGTAEASACGICHAATPSSADHTVHLSGTYGPNLGTDCSGCHNANGNNTSMAGKTTHINGTLTFTDGGAPFEIANGDIDNGSNTIDDCDACHGGVTAANTAKGYWFTADRVTCESCHGDNDLAVIGGVTAPSRAGANYDSWGHGRSVGGNTPNRTCGNCHAESSAHISGALGQDRLDNSPNNNYNYTTVGERNDYCNDCHTTVGAMNVHFDNSNTGGGDSTDGLYCVTCHDPHGQAGFDAMVDSSVGGATVGAGTQTVAGFTNRATRDDYRNASFTGVCQTCHDSGEVAFFDQDTEDANATHNPGSNCISCHAHTTAPAFKASCNGCHGDAVTGQYWPDGDTATQIDAANDDDGRHEEHVLLISQQLGYGNIAALLAHADTDSRQKTICTYCHAVNDDDHGLEANLPAEVFNATVGTVATDVAKAIWDGSIDADATFTKAGGTCATVDCHNNKTTTTAGPNDYSWDGANTSNCVMCHLDVTSGATPSHTLHTNQFTWNIGCADCHAGSPAWGDTADTGTQTAPSTGHMNGTYLIGGGDRTFTYTQGTGNCATNECHNDGTNGAPNVTAYNWANGSTAGFCGACHDFVINTGSHLPHAFAHNTIGGVGGTERFVNSAISCEDCHANLGYLSGTGHMNKSVSFKAGITYAGDKTVGDGSTVSTADFGTCSTLLCHNNGRSTPAAVETPRWDRTATATDDCSICHKDDSTDGMYDSHDAHVGSNGATSYVAAGSNQSTAGEYRFDCQLCHGNTIGNHINGSAQVSSASWNGTTCTNNSCHSNGTGGDANLAANWASGWVGEGDSDSCNNCHGNSPTSNAHQVHEVGIHFDTLYSGSSGLLSTGNTEPSAHGARWGDNTTGTSTVISCHICHFDTINVWYNDQNATCAACHGNTAPAKGNADVTDKRKHVDGNKDVAFQAIKIASKAQLRNDITTVPEVDANWERIKPDGVWAAIVGLFYKQDDSFDRAKTALDTATMFNSGAKTCSNISCHNGIEATWAAPAGDCSACHTTVSQ